MFIRYTENASKHKSKLYSEAVRILNINNEEAKIVPELSRDLTEIIQGYLGDDHDEKTVRSIIPDRSQLSFFRNEALLLAHFAAYHVLWGNPDKVKPIIMQNPDTLLCRVERTGPNGLQSGTLYQLLLWTDDNHFRNEHGETFVEMIRNILLSLPNGIKEEKAQREIQFRDWREEVQVAADRAAFDEVALAFDKSTATTAAHLDSDTTLQAAIVKFKEYLKPKSIITSGKNCIPQLWDYASNFYDFTKFVVYNGGYGYDQDYVSPKNNLFCQKILGTIDLRLPAWSMQVLRHGVFNANMHTDESIPRENIASLYDISPSTSIRRLGDNAFMDVRGVNATCLTRRVSDILRDGWGIGWGPESRAFIKHFKLIPTGNNSNATIYRENPSCTTRNKCSVM